MIGKLQCWGSTLVNPSPWFGLVWNWLWGGDEMEDSLILIGIDGTRKIKRWDCNYWG